MTDSSPAPEAAVQAAPEAAPETTSPAPEAATTSAPATLPNLGEGFDWRPEAFRQDELFSGYENLDAALNDLKSLKTVQAAHEKNGFVTLPTETSSPEEVAKFYQKLGMPESAAEYGFKRPEELPQGMDFSDEEAARFAQFAHEQKFTKSQAEAAFKFYHDKAIASFNDVNKTIEESLSANLTELETRWGAQQGTPQFEKNKENAQRAFNYVADQQLADKVKEDPFLSSNPVFMDVLARLGAKLSSDSVTGLGKNIPVGTFTNQFDPQAAKAEFISSGKFEKMKNSKNPMEQKALQAEWDSFFRIKE